MDAVDLIKRIERDLESLKKLVSEDPVVRYTGCRFVRGSHGSTYQHDPLGTDVPPPDWPYPRPTRAEIATAERVRLNAA
jgi:hypothetical protein